LRQCLERLDGEDLDAHYRHILVELDKKPGMLDTIFRKARNRIQDPANRKRMISDLIDRERWIRLVVHVKCDAYARLVEKSAADVTGGARSMTATYTLCYPCPPVFSMQRA
jgi:type I restriction enzyme M protein